MKSAITKREVRGPTQLTRFVLFYPNAQEVCLAGGFNNWNPLASPLRDLGHGHWVIEVPLPLGRHEYQFVVDGRWIHDRAATELVENPLGGLNSIVEVVRPPYNPISHKRAGKQITRQWKWHYQALMKLRRRVLEDTLQQINEVGAPAELDSMQIADSATHEFDRQLANGKLIAEQDLLYETEQAIQRIHNNTYGKCELTGKPIEAARLRAIPWTRFSKEAEAAFETGLKQPASEKLNR
jgi:RNA polymerase-binding transcription factor DksA